MAAFVARFWLWIAIGIFSLVGYVFRDHLPGNVTDLQVGDCFDRPAMGRDETVKDVQHRPCSGAHYGEVIFVGDLTGTQLPSDEALESFATSKCVPAFKSYLGRDYDADQTYEIGFYHPVAEGWGDGDREVTCYVFRLDRAAMSGSVRR